MGMSEDADKDSKTYAPTQQRIDDAFEEGQFAKAPEITVVAILAGCYLACTTTGPSILKYAMEGSVKAFSTLHTHELNPISVVSGALDIALFGAVLIGPILGFCLALGLFAGAAQTGFRFTPKVLDIKWSRINPIQGFQNLCSSHTLSYFVVDLAKFIFIGLILFSFVSEIIDNPIFHFRLDISYLGSFIFDITMAVLGQLILALGGIALLNYLYQRRKTFEDLKMTLEELKEEQKRMETNPHVKSAQRQMARKLLQKQMLDDVPLADVIVTNPTHYAVALRYERNKDFAPVVLAKGENRFALRIIERAALHSVPRVENRPVARLLFKMAPVGHPIPAELYQSVAEILAYVYKNYRYYFHRLKSRRSTFNGS